MCKAIPLEQPDALAICELQSSIDVAAVRLPGNRSKEARGSLSDGMDIAGFPCPDPQHTSTRLCMKNFKKVRSGRFLA